MSSGLNSLAAITGEDIIKSIWPNISEERYTTVNKIIGKLSYKLYTLGHKGIQRNNFTFSI